jgi:hypothetical protein
VVLTGAGWEVSHLDSDPEYGGSLSWEDGAASAELSWYPAESYDSYLGDRRAIGPERRVELLGQEGSAFSYGRSDAVPDSSDALLPDPTAGPDTPAGGSGDDPGAPDTVRRHLLLPPVGDWFLEVDVTLAADTPLRTFTAALRRVPEKEWVAYLADQDTVVPATAAAFLAEAGREVSLPPGVTVTAADLSLPQDGYQARVAFLQAVMCGWAERLEDARASGDTDAEQRATTALRASAGWPVMEALAADGEFDEVFAEGATALVAGRAFDVTGAWGCRAR